MEGSPLKPTDQNSWRDTAIYQVYLRGFADWDGDGTGVSRVSGASCPPSWNWVWTPCGHPWYLSPLTDSSYDMTDSAPSIPPSEHWPRPRN